MDDLIACTGKKGHIRGNSVSISKSNFLKAPAELLVARKKIYKTMFLMRNRLFNLNLLSKSDEKKITLTCVFLQSLKNVRFSV